MGGRLQMVRELGRVSLFGLVRRGLGSRFVLFRARSGWEGRLVVRRGRGSSLVGGLGCLFWREVFR